VRIPIKACWDMSQQMCVFSIRWDLQVEHVGARYAEFVFLHPVESLGHVVRSSASGARNIDPLCFRHGWASVDPNKCAQGHVHNKASGVCSMGPKYFRGTNRQCTIFHAWVGLMWIPIKACRDMAHQTYVISSAE
jgi:hypothetical protein